MDPLTIGLTLATQFAPSLIKWMTGSSKAEAVAQKAVDLAKQVTGKETGEAAIEALKADPNLVLQYQKAVLDNDLEFRRLALEETKAYIADTQDARKYRDDKTFWLGVTVLVSFAITITLVIFGAYKVLTGTVTVEPGLLATVAGLVGTLTGYVAANAQQVIGFFFGSSKGSSEKTDALADAIKGFKR